MRILIIMTRACSPLVNVLVALAALKSVTRYRATDYATIWPPPYHYDEGMFMYDKPN